MNVGGTKSPMTRGSTNHGQKYDFSNVAGTDDY